MPPHEPKEKRGWEHFKEEMRTLYLTQGMTLEQVITVIDQTYNFRKRHV